MRCIAWGCMVAYLTSLDTSFQCLPTALPSIQGFFFLFSHSSAIFSAPWSNSKPTVCLVWPETNLEWDECISMCVPCMPEGNAKPPCHPEISRLWSLGNLCSFTLLPGFVCEVCMQSRGWGAEQSPLLPFVVDAGFLSQVKMENIDGFCLLGRDVALLAVEPCKMAPSAQYFGCQTVICYSLWVYSCFLII